MPVLTIPPNITNINEGGRPTMGWQQWFTALRNSLTGSSFYIPAASGVPTDTPEVRAGFVPIRYDTANDRIYVYRGGAWRSVTVS